MSSVAFEVQSSVNATAAGSHRFDNFSVTTLGGGVHPKAPGLARPVAQSGLTPAPNQVFRLYYYAGSLRAAVRTLRGATGSNELYFLHADHLGSTSLTTNMSQAIVGQQRYFAYGEPRNGSGTLHTDRRFTGQREETGLGSLYDYNARYYSPLSGRFISADSIVPEPGNPQALNRYAYTYNNPLKYTDPSGHCPLCILAVVVAAIASGCAAPPTASPAVQAPPESVRLLHHAEVQQGDTLQITETESGGTLIGPDRLLTHSHFAPELGTASNEHLILTTSTGTQFLVPVNSSNVNRIDAGTTIVTLPSGLGLPVGTLASQSEINSIKVGDLVTAVFWDGVAQQNVAADFAVKDISALSRGQITLNDPMVVIKSGDSGSGVFRSGKLVGNIWSINTDQNNNPLGSFNVALLPVKVR